ncbi:MAG: type I glyceraldehyde-3-phosphate dehydrogenase [Parcubacteria group bacterium]|nr:type I glyceraldehyde-3-phosphate dehydrogenase [Parcubacteria group bacterium]
MPIKAAINGFGRMGRLTLRNVFDDPDIDVVAINSRGSAAFYAHLLKYDSSYGIWDKEVTAPTEKEIVINGKSIPLLNEKEDPAILPWDTLEVDVVIESTGVFKNRKDSTKHIEAGAKRVVVTTSIKDDDITLVAGVNLDDYNPKKHKIIAAASCTSNCLALTIKPIHEQLKIKHGFLTTVHAFTNEQHLVDAPHHKEDFRRARAATESIIPTSTGASETVDKIIPALKGKLNGMAMRVPIVLPSVVSLVLEFEKKITVKEINSILQKAAEGEMKESLGFSDKPLVSVDYRGDTRGAIIDGLSTEVVDDKMANIVSWYDNEWGYINQLVKVIKHIGK